MVLETLWKSYQAKQIKITRSGFLLNQLCNGKLLCCNAEEGKMSIIERYHKIFDKEILQKSRGVIFSFSPLQDQFIYQPYSHNISADSVEKLGELMRHNLFSIATEKRRLYSTMRKIISPLWSRQLSMRILIACLKEQILLMASQVKYYWICLCSYIIHSPANWRLERSFGKTITTKSRDMT